MLSKTCRDCKKNLPIADYYNGATGLPQCRCKKCSHIFRKKYKKPKVNNHKEGTRECNTCNVVKPLAEFTRNKICSDGYTLRCKACNYEARNSSKNKEIDYSAFYMPINVYKS